MNKQLPADTEAKLEDLDSQFFRLHASRTLPGIEFQAFPPHSMMPRLNGCKLPHFHTSVEQEGVRAMVPCATPEWFRAMTQLRQMISKAPPKGKPGRRGYSPQALTFAKKLRAKHPEMKAHMLRKECLKHFPSDDLPINGEAFRRWLNRNRAK